MSYQVAVENIKCGGCANTIKTKLQAESGVSAVEVDIEAGMVRIEGEELDRAGLVQRLAQLGYPEAGSVEGLKAAAVKAKSFVSCAIGRMDDGSK